MTYFPTVCLLISLLLCSYVLVVMFLVRKAHASAAWHFIFFGLTLLWVEVAQALHLVWGEELSSEETLFIVTILVKSVSYAVGFTIWKFIDLQSLRQRYEDDCTDKTDAK